MHIYEEEDDEWWIEEKIYLVLFCFTFWPQQLLFFFPFELKKTHRTMCDHHSRRRSQLIVCSFRRFFLCYARDEIRSGMCRQWELWLCVHFCNIQGCTNKLIRESGVWKHETSSVGHQGKLLMCTTDAFVHVFSGFSAISGRLYSYRINNSWEFYRVFLQKISIIFLK